VESTVQRVATTRRRSLAATACRPVDFSEIYRLSPSPTLERSGCITPIVAVCQQNYNTCCVSKYGCAIFARHAILPCDLRQDPQRNSEIEFSFAGLPAGLAARSPARFTPGWRHLSLFRWRGYCAGSNRHCGWQRSSPVITNGIWCGPGLNWESRTAAV